MSEEVKTSETPDETIFGDQTKDSQVEPPASNPLPDEVTGLIGEGKKYSTTEEALKALYHSQNHISTIEDENRKMREQIKEQESKREFLDKLKASSSEGEANPNLDPNSINQMINENLSQREQQKKLTDNMQSVDNQMKQMYGSKAQEVLVAKATDLGMTIDQMANVAANSPSAFLNWFEQVKPTETPNLTSNLNMDGTTPQSGGEVTPFSYKYFQNLRKENPSEYMSEKVQIQMHNKMQELGEGFWR